MSFSGTGLSVGEHTDIVSHQRTFNKRLYLSPYVFVRHILGEHTIEQKMGLFLPAHTSRLGQVNMSISDVELRTGVVGRTHSGVDLNITTHVFTLVKFLIDS